jgi:hypothetical protein
LPEHCFCCGAQTPAQLAVEPLTTQVWLVQADAVPNWPWALQDCTPLFEQRDWPGAHSPRQAALEPLTTQVLLVHAEEAPYWPWALHACTPLLEQRDWPGAHWPTQLALPEA